jgi:hypothetical protein
MHTSNSKEIQPWVVCHCWLSRRDNVQNRPAAAQLKVQGRQAIHLQFRVTALALLADRGTSGNLSIGCICEPGRNWTWFWASMLVIEKRRSNCFALKGGQVIEKTQEAGLKPGTTFRKEGKRTGTSKQGREARTGSSERKSDRSRRSLRRLLEERHSR